MEQLSILESSEKPELNWKALLSDEKSSNYFKKILEFVESERSAGKIIYPKNSEIFRALSLTPLEDVKVVVLGQDPYHGPNQAHGLCFSVNPNMRFPPSLQNIFKELQSDLNIPKPSHGCLEKWAKQGVLLLNDVLSVQAGRAHSHAGIGWQRFTDKVVSLVNAYTSGTVFLLWGSHAQKKGAIIDPNKHYILAAPHPSPFSANRGFFGCKHFSETNRILKKQGKDPIDWSLD